MLPCLHCEYKPLIFNRFGLKTKKHTFNKQLRTYLRAFEKSPLAFKKNSLIICNEN